MIWSTLNSNVHSKLKLCMFLGCFIFVLNLLLLLHIFFIYKMSFSYLVPEMEQRFSERDPQGLLPIAHYWSFSHVDYGLILDEKGGNHASLEGDALTLKPAITGQGLLTKASAGTVVNAGRVFMDSDVTLGFIFKYDVSQGQAHMVPFQCNQDWPYQPSLFEVVANYSGGNLIMTARYAYLSTTAWTSHVITSTTIPYSGAFTYLSLAAAKTGQNYNFVLHIDGNEVGSGTFSNIPGKLLHGCLLKINGGNFTSYTDKTYYIDEVFLWKSALTPDNIKNVTLALAGK